MSIRILLADDHQILRQGLRTLLGGHPDMEVIAEAEDGQTTVRLARELSPDVVIMDIGMPGLNGIEATRRIVDKSPGIKVVVLSMHTDRQFVAEMLKAGASAYLPKGCDFDELTLAINTVLADKIYLSPEIAGVVVEDYVRHLIETNYLALSSLTPREREVLQLLAEGKSTNQIASELHTSAKTVGTHRQNLMTKLDLHNLADITKYAIRAGLISLEP